MAEAVTYAIATIGAEVGGTIGAHLIIYAEGIALTALAAASVYTLREQQRRSQNQQRAAYNESLKDRYAMVRSAIEPRAVVLGRQRVAGPVAYVGSYGVNRQHLVLAMVLAAHEIDAVEAIYFDDERVTLDGSGNVLGVSRRDVFTLSGAGATFTLSSAPAAASVAASVAYGTTVVALSVSVAGSAVTVGGGTVGQAGTVTISYQPASSPYINTTPTSDTATVVLDGSGAGSVTLPEVPDAGSVHVVYDTGVSIDERQSIDYTGQATVAGPVVTIAGGPPGLSLVVSYTYGGTGTKARVRTYLGSAGQSADAGMVAALPGVWTAAHTMAGLAYMVLELDYDPDAFPGGIPNPSALVRGAKLFDPRTNTTAFSQNPALMMRYVATSPLLGRQAAAAVNDATVITAANVCDSAATYVVNGQTHSRPLYTAGLVAKSGVRGKDVLDDLAAAMAGRWVVVDGQLRVKAGAYVTPLQTLDDTWPINTQAVQMQGQAARADVFNVVTGKFSDEQRDFQVLDYPRVAASAYITADGAELPVDVSLNAVTFTGQAQQVAACSMRDARYGKRLTVLCNLRAYPVEVFDVLNVTLSRFGWVNRPFEVLDVAWTVDGGIQLTLKETDPSIWAMGTAFAAQQPPANTLIRSPFDVPAITGLSCASGAGTALRQSDGTAVSRIAATWTAVTDPAVLEAGGVEVRYGLATTPDDQWQTATAAGAQATLYLEGVRDGLIYLVKARAFNFLRRGAWSAPVLHQVQGIGRKFGNILDGSQWEVGTTGTQGVAPFRFNEIANAGENSIILGAGPDGQLQPLWRCISNDSAAGEDGGWNTDPFPVDHNGAYRFEQWVRCSGTMDGNVYFGCGFSTVRNIGGGINSNPYFAGTARSALTAGRWYLLVGYVLPSGYAGAQLNQGGIWDGETGQKLGGSADFQWVVGQANTMQRSYQWYASVGAEQWFTPPAVRLLDGNEPNISSLLSAAALGRANAAMTNAATAQNTANDATTALANIASDSILSPSEKPAVVQDYNVITSEQAGIDAQATAYGITTEKTAYDSAVTALTTYLGTLSGWNTVPGADVAIVGSTFRATFAAVYTAKQALLNAIAASAGTRASWSNVSGVNVTTTQIAPGAATDIVNAGGAISIGKPPAWSGAFDITDDCGSVTWTNPTASAVNVQVQVNTTQVSTTYNGAYVTVLTSTLWTEWTINGGSATSRTVVQKSPDPAVQVPASGSAQDVVSVPAGGVLVYTLKGRQQNSTSASKITGVFDLSATAIKR